MNSPVACLHFVRGQKSPVFRLTRHIAADSKGCAALGRRRSCSKCILCVRNEAKRGAKRNSPFLSARQSGPTNRSLQSNVLNGSYRVANHKSLNVRPRSSPSPEFSISTRITMFFASLSCEYSDTRCSSPESVSISSQTLRSALDCAELSRACIASTSIWIGPSESQGIPPVKCLRAPEISCSPTRATGAPWLLAPVLAVEIFPPEVALPTSLWRRMSVPAYFNCKCSSCACPNLAFLWLGFSWRRASRETQPFDRPRAPLWGSSAHQKIFMAKQAER